jgi:hypothetical protein
MGQLPAAVMTARQTVALHDSVQFRQRIRDLYRGDLRQPFHGDRSDLLAALIEGRKTLELNPTYAPLCVEQAILEKEAGYEEGARECSRRAGQLLSELRRRDDQRTFREQMGEIEPLRKNAPLVFQWVMEEMQTGGEWK